MAKPTSKSELLTTAAAGYEQLNELIASLTEQELSTPFSFDEKKKEAHWRRDKNLRDVLDSCKPQRRNKTLPSPAL